MVASVHQAKREGHSAFIAGRPLDANPYTPNGSPWSAWRRGWNEAFADSMRRMEDGPRS